MGNTQWLVFLLDYHDYACLCTLCMGRVPAVMESQGKSWENLWSLKVMEDQKISKVMEK